MIRAFRRPTELQRRSIVVRFQVDWIAVAMQSRNLREKAGGENHSEAAVAHKATILVVDDEQNFAALLETVLTDRGYGVQKAFSADSALELVSKGVFDLALLDVRMGHASGLTLLTDLKTRVPQIKVIMLTAYPTADGYQQSFQRGASAYCTKPVDLPNLLETIRKELS
jgi:DNA-binding NtrC family response regulator